MLSSLKSKIGNVFLPIHLWAFLNGVISFFDLKGTGDEATGLGIHRGGGASMVSTASANNRTTTNKQTNGSSRSSGATGGVHQLTSTADSRQSSTRLVGNGLVPRDLDKVSNASAANTTMANRYSHLPNIWACSFIYFTKKSTLPNLIRPVN